MFGEPLVHPFLEAIEGHPEILRVVKEPTEDLTFGGEYWHTDISFREPPAAASLLYSIEVPPARGDTLFANQHLALESRSAGMHDMLSGMRAHHVYPEMSENDSGAAALHPVVRVHPVSGRAALFVNPAFTTRFEAMGPEESRPLLDFLHERQVRPEYTVRIGWCPRMLLIWDNRATLHYGLNDYPGRRRLLHRVTAMEEPA